MFILPIRKDAPVRHTSWVVYALIIANFSVFAATSIFSSGEGIARRYGFIPAEPDPTAVFTSMFLHGDILHLLGNMFFLWMFGESVEEAVGHIATAIGYLACGIVAIAVFDLSNPRSQIPCIGASGAISGMMGMYVVLFPKAKIDIHVYMLRIRVSTIHTTSIWAALAWFGEQTILGIFSSTTGLTFGIAFWAHVGGLLAGIGLGAMLTPSGFSGHYQRLVARRASQYMICPACGEREPRKPAGNYTCRGCARKLHVDETGQVGLVEPSQTKPPVWIVLAVVLVALGWVARAWYNFLRH
jgi:membrane associated rhomboid family serine protease